MLIQVNTDNHITGSEELTHEVQSVVARSLGRFGERITRVEVHLSDESSIAKSGNADKRCAMEARLAGLKPMTASHQSASLEEAVEGAADKLEKMLRRTLGRLDDAKGRISHAGDQTD